DPVTLAKILALRFGLVEAPTKFEKFVAPHGGPRSAISNRLRCGLPNDGEPFLEVERCEPRVVDVQLLEVDSVGGLLVALRVLYDHVLHIVQYGSSCVRPITRPALGPPFGELQVSRNVLDVEIKKDLRRRAIRMRRLPEQFAQPGDGRPTL